MFNSFVRPLSVLLIFALLFTYVSYVFAVGVVVMTMDCLARFRDYNDLKNRPYSRYFVRQLRKSWCGRGVSEALWGHSARRAHRDMGYRWYHILPDEAPACFFKKSFWKSVLGMRRLI